MCTSKYGNVPQSQLSIDATVDAECGSPDGAAKLRAASAAEIGAWYYGGACPKCGAFAPIAQDGRKSQASILHYLSLTLAKNSMG